MDEVWGYRVFEYVDPFGYVWEFSQLIANGQPADGFEAVQEKWFGAK